MSISRGKEVLLSIAKATQKLAGGLDEKAQKEIGLIVTLLNHPSISATPKSNTPEFLLDVGKELKKFRDNHDIYKPHDGLTGVIRIFEQNITPNLAADMAATAPSGRPAPAAAGSTTTYTAGYGGVPTIGQMEEKLKELDKRQKEASSYDEISASYRKDGKGPVSPPASPRGPNDNNYALIPRDMLDAAKNKNGAEAARDGEKSKEEKGFKPR